MSDEFDFVRPMHAGGRTSPTDGVYVRVTKEKTRTGGGTYDYLTIKIGQEVCKAARWQVKDRVNVGFSKDRRRILVERTNEGLYGLKVRNGSSKTLYIDINTKSLPPDSAALLDMLLIGKECEYNVNSRGLLVTF